MFPPPSPSRRPCRVCQFAAVAAFLVAPGAWAVALGPVQVRSTLGEPLRAEVALTGSPPGRGCTVSLPQASETATVPALEVRRIDGVVEVRSRTDVREPVVTFVLELACPDGPRLRRKYTLLLDPPLPVALAPVRRRVEPAAVSGPPAPARSRETPPSSWRVRRGDTLLRIAARYVPAGGAARWRFVEAIMDANPQIFPDRNPDRLPAGVRLRIPDPATVAAALPRAAAAPAKAPEAPARPGPQPRSSARPSPEAEPPPQRPGYRLELARLPDPAVEPERDAARDSLEARAERLMVATEAYVAENEALKARIASLEEEIRRLTRALEALQAAGVLRPPPAAGVTVAGPVPPAAGEDPGRDAWWAMGLGVLVAGTGLMYLMRRRAERAEGEEEPALAAAPGLAGASAAVAPPPAPTPPRVGPHPGQTADPLEAALARGGGEPASPPTEPAPAAPAPAAARAADAGSGIGVAGVELAEERVAADPETGNVLVRAEFHLLLRQPERAIALLEEAIRGEGGRPDEPAPWLMLLRIHRQQGMRDAFEETEARFRERFNIRVPSWDDWYREQDEEGGLEERYPRILQAIISLWSTPRECARYLDRLILDDRGGIRLGFELPVAEDLLLLRGLLRLRAGL